MSMNMFNQLQECATKIVFVFGPQTGITITLATPTTMKVTVLVFVETTMGVHQVQTESIFEAGQPGMAPGLWTTNVVNELKVMVNDVLKKQEKDDE